MSGSYSSDERAEAANKKGLWALSMVGSALGLGFVTLLANGAVAHHNPVTVDITVKSRKSVSLPLGAVGCEIISNQDRAFVLTENTKFDKMTYAPDKSKTSTLETLCNNMQAGEKWRFTHRSKGFLPASSPYDKDRVISAKRMSP